MKYRIPGHRRSFFFGVLVTAMVLLGQLFAYPSAVRNIIDLSFIDGVDLRYPLVYILFTPVFQIADSFSLLSVKQILIMFIYLNTVWLVWRVRSCLKNRPGWIAVATETNRFIGVNASFLLLIMILAVIPRPMPALTVPDPDTLVVDFHGHTYLSWDGRHNATPLVQLRKRKAGGYHAAFITDHNTRLGSREAQIIADDPGFDGAIPLRGEEHTLWKSHWIVLGPGVTSPNKELEGLPGIIDFIRQNNQHPETIIIASLPEWWLYQQDNLDTFLKEGMGGIEIASSVPRAKDFTIEDRAEIMEWVRENGLIAYGIMDDHGWGYTDYIWNLMQLPGWRNLERLDLERAIIEALSEGGPDTVTVAARIKAETTRNVFLMILDPFRQIWSVMRTLPSVQAFVMILWSWLPFGLVFAWYRTKKRSQH